MVSTRSAAVEALREPEEGLLVSANPAQTNEKSWELKSHDRPPPNHRNLVMRCGWIKGKRRRNLSEDQGPGLHRWAGLRPAGPTNQKQVSAGASGQAS